MSTYKVATQELENMADRIDRVSHDFEVIGKNHRPHGYSPALLGTDDVVDGLEEFFGKWNDGMHKIHKKLDDLGKRLHLAAEAYAEAEGQVLKAATPGGP